MNRLKFKLCYGIILVMSVSVFSLYYVKQKNTRKRAQFLEHYYSKDEALPNITHVHPAKGNTRSGSQVLQRNHSKDEALSNKAHAHPAERNTRNRSQVLQCFHSKDQALPNIVHAHPAKGKSIFFHETSCVSSTYGKIFITSRQACAVESAAKLNPNFEIYLLYASPGVIKNEGTESDRFLQALLSYKNVKIHHLDYKSYVKNTLVEDLYTGGKIEHSKHAIEYASDVLRYVTMWKYGGIYLDLDVVVIKSLEELPLNYAGTESKGNIAAGVLSFDYEGIGHNLSGECLQDLQHNFDGTIIWGRSGPGVITRVIKQRCGNNTISEKIEKTCIGNFRVYPRETFYSIHWTKWKMFFANESNAEVENLTRTSYTVHTWNKHSFKIKLSVDSNTPYINFAKKFCPKVYSECKFFF